MRDQKMYCYTCQSDEQHRPLMADEKIRLKNRTGRKNVDDVFMCTAPNCRNLRTGFNKRPFDPVIRMPLD
ncbi:hypothetical protein QCN29_30820 [Streptomyces sp. HNM0663]|uniref:Uncharacterized protein n=1 Tax=Streptomyces chengmaiensis TaxID=3040919 RepID=A0ABT6HXU8_9ACTN|nr:hypothetical protein [Streptomyces chengmaiensis]MDH2393093.1 hypothetical protein [Streptomyces chengmaiensis]